MQVFISYSHVDKPFVQKLAKALEELGVEYFLDEKDIEWGRNVPDAIAEAMRQSPAVLVVISPASLKSHWVPFEVGQALALRKDVLPLLTHPSLDLPGYLANLNYKTDLNEVIEYFRRTSQSLQTAEGLDGIHQRLREDTSLTGAQQIDLIRQIAEGPSKAAKKHLSEIASGHTFYFQAEIAAALAALKNIAEGKPSFDLLSTVEASSPANKVQGGGPASLAATIMFWERAGSKTRDLAFEALMKMLKGGKTDPPES